MAKEVEGSPGMWSQENRVYWQGEGGCSNAAEGPGLTSSERFAGFGNMEVIDGLDKISSSSQIGLKGKWENGKGGNTVQFILWDHYYPDTKTRQGYYKKRKLHTNISYEYQCKNPQQSIANRTQQHIKRIVVHYDQEEFIPRMQDWFKVGNQLM